MRRTSEDVISTPSGPDSIDNRTRTDPCAPRPFFGTHGFTAMRDHYAIGLVPGLLSNSGPSAVRRPPISTALRALTAGVVAVVVDPINLKTGWRLTHVSQERSKVMPLLAQPDPTTSVARMGFTPLGDPRPYLVRPGPPSAEAMAMLQIPAAGGFCASAATRRTSADNACAVSDAFIAASAPTYPHRPSTTISPSDHGHMPKCMPG